MRMKLITLFTFTIFTFSSCSGGSIRPSDPISETETSASTSESPESSETTDASESERNRESIDAPLDVWDVSDVSLSDVDKNRKLIAFTFDDAPARTMENILTVFVAYNEANPDCKAFATFFLNGYLFHSESVHLLNGAIALGMELGNHTYSHADLTKLSPEEMQREIDENDRLLQSVDGKERHLLRAPFGKINRTVRTIAQTPLIDWNIDTLDWSGKSADEIFRIVYEEKTDGAIVLMHDGYTPTVNALKRLLPALKQANYQVVGVSQLAKAHDCVLENGKAYIRARASKERT